MSFDSSPQTMQSLSKALAFEEHIIRINFIKLGDSIKVNMPRPEQILTGT
jgi:ribosomal protein S6